MIYIWVGTAGMAGALSRYLLGLWIQNSGIGGSFPLATLFINLAGCFLLAFFYTWAAQHTSVHPHVRTAVGTGFIGSFTTFSTFSYEALQLMQHGQAGLAASYVLVSLLGGYATAVLGIRMAVHPQQEGSKEGEE